MNKKKTKTISVHVYGILDRKKQKITKVSLDKEDIKLDIDLENFDGRLMLCEFDLRIVLPL